MWGKRAEAYIRIHNKIDVIIDADYMKWNDDVMHWGKYMPFYDRTLEYVFLPH